MVVPWARGVGVMLLFVLVAARFLVWDFLRQGWSPALPSTSYRSRRFAGAKLCAMLRLALHEPGAPAVVV